MAWRCLGVGHGRRGLESGVGLMAGFVDEVSVC